MIDEEQIEKTVIVSDHPLRVIKLLQKWLSSIEFNDEMVICVAESFYKHNKQNRKKCLRVDTHEAYKGLESPVVIVFNPDINFDDLLQMNSKASADYYVSTINGLLMAITRATCFTIIITTYQQAKLLTEIQDEKSLTRKQFKKFKHRYAERLPEDGRWYATIS